MIFPSNRVRIVVATRPVDYRGEDIEFRAGARIRWTRNDAGLGLVISRTADVAAVRDGKVTLRLEDGRMLDLASGDPRLRRLDCAWASMRAAGCGGSGPSRILRPGYAVVEAALAEDASGVPGVVADFPAELGDGVAHGLWIGAAPVAPHPAPGRLVDRRPAGVEREGVQELVLDGGEPHRTAGDGHPARRAVDSKSNHYAANENLHMTA